MEALYTFETGELRACCIIGLEGAPELSITLSTVLPIPSGSINHSGLVISTPAVGQEAG